MWSILVANRCFGLSLPIILFVSALAGCANTSPSLNSSITQTPATTSPSSSTGIPVADKDMAVKVNRQTEYLIQPGDELDLKFFYNPELDDTVTVRPDGKIALQLLEEEIHTQGLTPAQLDSLLTEKYSDDLRRPEVAVILRSFSGQQVYVGGEVNKQGVLALSNGMTVLQAVVNAGGFNSTAKPEAAFVIRRTANNEPTPLLVDLQKVIEFNDPSADFQLQPYDIVYIPASRIAALNQFVDQYIKKLFLFNGFGARVF